MLSHAINYGCAFSTPVPHVPAPGGGTRLAMITTQWHRARSGLQIPTNFSSIDIHTDGMEIADARNKVVRIVMAHEPRPEYIFFIDYDVVAPYDAFTKLHRRAREWPEYDIFGGVYCAKSSSGDPLIYKGNGIGPYWEWSIGDILSEGITGIHMGLTLIRTSLFERIAWDDDDNPLFKTINLIEEPDHAGSLRRSRGTEDLYFCQRAVEEAGARILVDTSVLAGHIDHSTGRIYGLPMDSRPVLGSRWAIPNDAQYKEENKALDIGAGATRRKWDGYRTYTTDIREGVADYAMDTRSLNFPDNNFDMVASSHHLEHIGRWEQEQTWHEMFRILKPGGRMEHVVPNLAWAAAKIHAEATIDEHVMNVLYGAQEAHGYSRDFNTHYFGYTPTVAKALAEMAGLVDVKIKDYHDDPDLGYNLIITGVKPFLIEDEDDVPEKEADSVSEKEPTGQNGNPYDGWQCALAGIP
jgi:SAM-dependent methyltransferase